MMSSASDQSQPMVYKKLRSKLPQRKRCRWQLSSPLPSLSVNSSVSAVSPEQSYLGGKDTKNNAKMLRTQSYLINRRYEDVGAAGHEASEVIETSESLTSWCGSSPGVVKRQKNRIVKHLKASEENEASESTARSEVSSIHQHSPTKSDEFSSKFFQKVPENVEKNRRSAEFKENDVVRVTSAIEFCHKTDAASSFTELQDKIRKRNENRTSEFESSISTLTMGSTMDQKPKSANLKFDADLACKEQLTYSDRPADCSCHDESFSDLQPDIFLDSSDYEFSSSPSLSFDSGSQFSEKSTDDSALSYTFALLIQYREQFLRSGRSSLPVGKRTSTVIYDEKLIRLGFDVEEDALSYQILRNRERRQLLRWNFSEEHSELVIDQRSRMIHWMIEQSRVKKLQRETLFLGVSIFDRFLKAGSFKLNRNLQIAGIASLTLATRIEENQPYNSVRQMVFSVGSNIYRRCEVVAMEWLIQEALSFQCSSPTVYNFLWFYLRAARADGQLNKKVKDLGELTLMDHELLCFWPSTVAASLVILACPEDSTAQRVIMTHVRTQDDDLPKCIESLQWLVKYIC